MRSHTQRGFSLVELLAVVAIISILMALGVPALTSMLEAGRLTQATTILAGQFTLARQKAIAENRPIALRFIRKDSSSPFNGVQLVSLDSSGNATPVSRASLLPSQTALASSPTLSSLLDPADEKVAASAKDPSILDFGTSYRYIQVSFRPRGSMDEDIQKCWFVTTVFERDAAKTSVTDLKNYSTVQVDPVNGGIQVYRP